MIKTLNKIGMSLECRRASTGVTSLFQACTRGAQAASSGAQSSTGGSDKSDPQHRATSVKGGAAKSDPNYVRAVRGGS